MHINNINIKTGSASYLTKHQKCQSNLFNNTNYDQQELMLGTADC